MDDNFLKEQEEYLSKINSFLKEHNYYGVIWFGSLVNQIVICELPENPSHEKTTVLYSCYREEFHDKYGDGKILYSLGCPNKMIFKNIYEMILSKEPRYENK